MHRLRVLIADNRGELLMRASVELDASEFDVETVAVGPQMYSRLVAAPLPDVVILDTAAVPAPGNAIAHMRRLRPLLTILVQTSRSELNELVKAIQAGANAGIGRPIADGELEQAIRECVGSSDRPVQIHKEAPGDVVDFDDGGFFVAASPAMRKLRADLERVARIDVPVLCLGESGSGKEVAAKWLHRMSIRAHHTFLKVNCAAMPSELLESELFGYERGAFTGAVRAKPGKFELCRNGTMFLDEIAEMPVALQAKLLHVVQDREFVRLGGRDAIRIQVRVIAATNVDIKKAIAGKLFREDLYYRLSVFVFEIPPLRERREDIPILLLRYMKHHASALGLPERVISNQLWQRCLKYEWPGNVRQLETFAKRYLLFGEEAADLERADAAAPVNLQPTFPQDAPADLKAHVREMKDGAEASAIARALEQTRWNRRAAAELLSISYKSLLTKIRQHGLDHRSTRSATP